MLGDDAVPSQPARVDAGRDLALQVVAAAVVAGAAVWAVTRDAGFSLASALAAPLGVAVVALVRQRSVVWDMYAQARLLRQRERELAELRAREAELDALTRPPDQVVEVAPFLLACHSQHAAACGGDWWSFRRLPRGQLLLVIGDVTGHGLAAALIAAHARGAVAALEATSGTPITPTRVLMAVDRAIRALGDGARHSTCFAMVIDPITQSVEFANASHCFPYALPTIGRTELDAIVARGNPLGSPELCIAEGRRALRPGEVFVLYTDGVADRLAEQGGRDGQALLRGVLGDLQDDARRSGAKAVRDAVRAKVSTGVGADALTDDLTLIVCEFTGTKRRARPRTTMRCRVVQTDTGQYSIMEEELSVADG